MKKKYDKCIAILALGFILIFIILVICNLKLSNNKIEFVFYLMWLIMLVILALSTNDQKSIKCRKKTNSIICIVTIFSIISLVRIKENQIILLFYIIEFYCFLHFLEKILEKKEIRDICIKYFLIPFIMNFLRFFIIWLIFLILNKDENKYELFSSKYSNLYALGLAILDSAFIGLYEFYSKKEKIVNKISFIKIFKYYSWIFFIIYSTFIFITYSNLVSWIIILIIGSYLVLKICFLKDR